MKMRAVIVFLIVCSFAQAQRDKEFHQKFMQAKEALYMFKPQEALPLFKELLSQDPDNANIMYLIGACYTDVDPKSDQSIFYLEKARPYVNPDYDPDSPDENKASIHLYYFLAVAYSQHHRCYEAQGANDYFKEKIGKIGGAYIRDAQFWVNECFELTKNIAVAPDTILKQPKYEDDPYEIKNAKFVTQDVEYTTPIPLYGVQVGSFSKFVPMTGFDDIKNVEAFIAKDGRVKYVVGSFVLRQQAETVKRVLIESGYTDAFIVDVNKERRFHDKIITVNDIPVHNQIRGKVHFRLQIGAFRDTIPQDMAEKYVKIDGIKENQQGELTLLSVGHFETYEDATAAKPYLEHVGIMDSFVVAYNYDKKITVKQAKEYIDKKRVQEQ